MNVSSYRGDGSDDLLYSEARTYDSETGRIASVSKQVLGQGIGAVSYVYDEVGDLSTISHPSESVFYEYDFFGRMERARRGDAEWVYQYNAAGRKSRVEDMMSGLVETREYTALGHLDKITQTRANGEVAFETDFELGVDGSRVGALETRGVNQTRWVYLYDELGRLTRERRDVGDDGSFGRDVSYTYDADSNRKTVTDHNDADENETYYYEANSLRLDRIEKADGTRKEHIWTANGEQALVAELDDTGSTTSQQVHTWGLDSTLREARQHEFDEQTLDLEEVARIEYLYDHVAQLIGRREYSNGAARPALPVFGGKPLAE